MCGPASWSGRPTDAASIRIGTSDVARRVQLRFAGSQAGKRRRQVGSRASNPAPRNTCRTSGPSRPPKWPSLNWARKRELWGASSRDSKPCNIVPSEFSGNSYPASFICDAICRSFGSDFRMAIYLGSPRVDNGAKRPCPFFEKNVTAKGACKVTVRVSARPDGIGNFRIRGTAPSRSGGQKDRLD
jgi:hypothetical protein